MSGLMAIKPLKKSKSGEEVEFFILDNRGHMVNEAPNLIRLGKRKYPELRLDKEAGQNMIETSSFPSVNVLRTFVFLMENIKKLIELADQHGYLIYPNATYPGRIEPKITQTPRYREQTMLFGEKRQKWAALICGFHYHYTLPKGVFDFQKRFLKESKNSKLKQALIDSYNLAISFDPVVTALLQSSPFVQGQYLAKDSRLLIYRGGRKLGFMEGKYAKHQQLGGLPPYKQTLNDLVFSLKKRQSRWKEMMEKKGLDPKKSIKGTNILDYTWNPIRINPLGTLELRGMDMNHPKYIMGVASLLKFVFRKVYRDFYKVIPSDVGLSEPFKIEGDIIHIPPHTHVRNHLQKESAYKGFDSDDIYSYTRRFYRFARHFLDSNYLPVVKPLYSLIEEKQTVSDRILKRLKRWGYSKEDNLPADIAAESALKSCEKLLKEVDETESKLYHAYDLEDKSKKK
ncbi:hypothetical protein GF323_02915 [Candidatus Woesearchaeota archaeon]|nr:hypothetical protein [Candidatus Woesearchaeota archaeon]